jgi:hypothetical protein
MDLKKYDKLRKKNDTKDFEGKNKGLDKWLFGFSFLGNASSIFFAYFLLFPALLKAATLNLGNANAALALAFGLTLAFLTIFEIIKRFFVKNFSNDFVTNAKKVSFKMVSWLGISAVIVALSFYLSISGSKNFASTSTIKDIIASTEVSSETDSLTAVFDARKAVYSEENISLRTINADLREKLAGTEVTFRTIRREYQVSIDKNAETITGNEARIAVVDAEFQARVQELNLNLDATKSDNEDDDKKTKVLFVIIVVMNELLIIGGLYFREYFEYTLYVINQDKFEKIYQKKDRYKALANYIYNDGKVIVGEKVMPSLKLKDAIAEKTKIQNPKKFVDEFLRDMERLGIFETVGKRRNIVKSYQDALDIIENYDDSYRVLENLK